MTLIFNCQIEEDADVFEWQINDSDFYTTRSGNSFFFEEENVDALEKILWDEFINPREIGGYFETEEA